MLGVVLLGACDIMQGNSHNEDNQQQSLFQAPWWKSAEDTYLGNLRPQRSHSDLTNNWIF